MAYWRLHYHLVWATYRRLPLINAERARVIRETIYAKAEELGCILHATGGIADHIHVVISIPPRLSISDCLRHLKGASSRAVNQLPGARADFKWQEGYGALSIGERSLPDAIAYAKYQRQHHQQRTTKSMFERLTEEHDDGGGAPAGD